jgi:hypothetical protein
VVGADTREPVSYAIVVLLDQRGSEEARGLTDVTGRFFLATSAPGIHRIRAMRIGYRSWRSDEFRLSSGQVLDYEVRMPEVPVELTRITAEKENPCHIYPGHAERTATLWEETAKTLSVTQLTAEQKAFRFRTVVFRRILNRDMSVIVQESDTISGLSYWPFVSLPAESLAHTGFVLDSSGVPVYVAPDIAVVASNSFLEYHCFRVQEHQPPDTGLIGLAFEPVGGRHIPDIAGVLWLDRQSAELRCLEYVYKNLEDWVPPDRAGGRIDFYRLPTGAWIMRRWLIRAPVPIVKAHQVVHELYGYREGGGEVVEVLTIDGRTLKSF